MSGDPLNRIRVTADALVGEVGIGGIKADAPYRCENGRLVEVDR